MSCFSHPGQSAGQSVVTTGGVNTWLLHAEVNSECDMVKLAMDIMVQVGVVECGVMVEDVLRGLVGPLYNAPMKGEMFVVPKCKFKLTKLSFYLCFHLKMI